MTLLTVAALAFGLPLTLLAIIYALAPKSHQLVLSKFPSPVWLYAQVPLSLVKTVAPRKYSHPMPEVIEVNVTRPKQFNVSRFQGFLKLCDFKGTQGETPLMYPIVEAFRLCIQAMLLPAFPFNVLGSVLARNTVTMYRSLAVDEGLVYRCTVDPHFRNTPKGDTEVDLICTASSAGDRQLVWTNVLTVIILAPRRPRPAGSAAPAADKAPAGDASKREVIDVWQLRDDVGRKYGALNGDLNPIHLYPATSRLFGFKRPIAHALFLVARAEAALRNKGVVPVYPAVFATEFKRPTLLPATLQCTWEPVADVASALKAGKPVNFAVLTEDGAKEVIVGSLLNKSD